MVELEDEQEREAQKQAVGCHGLHGRQYSPPTRHIIELQNPQTLTHPQNKREIERERYRNFTSNMNKPLRQ